MKNIKYMILFLSVLSIMNNYTSEVPVFTPEQIEHMKDSVSFFNLKEGIAAGTFTKASVLKIAEEISTKEFAKQEYNDPTLFLGQIHAILFGCGYRIGMENCSLNANIAGFSVNPTVSTKKLLVTTAVVAALAIAYKKGYFAALKNYFCPQSDDTEDNQI